MIGLTPKSWGINDKEFDAVSGLPFQRRYEYFVKRVADWETVWSLVKDAGWVLVGDSECHEVVPVWPHERYAAACAIDGWAGALPRSIRLDDWLNKWLPGIERDQRLVVVFMTPGSKGAVVTVEALKADLEEELRNYE